VAHYRRSVREKIEMNRLPSLLQQLEKTRSPNWKAEVLVYIIAILYACVAYLQGPKHLLMYFCILTVIFSVWSRIEVKRKREIELLKEIIEELEKSKTEPARGGNG
jgi:hypothetical protein